MKKFSPLFLLFCFVVLVSSCSKEEDIIIEPPVTTPTTNEDQGSFELTYDPANVSTEQEIFEEEGVTDADQENGGEVLDATVMDSPISVDRTPQGPKPSSTTTEGQTTTVKIHTRSE